jgi:hypothetical protein
MEKEERLDTTPLCFRHYFKFPGLAKSQVGVAKLGRRGQYPRAL